MLVIGSDSHTCSAGSVSCLAIGLGVADVILPLITGETWFKIPETVEIRFVNKPKPAISGKDVILYIFIGACTTTEELVLAALVLEQAMKLGAKPKRSGKRKVVPGSMPILHNLRKHGLIDIYERAGWEVGVPGCSYCVGMSADQAGKGETWLTSQNRNFENRMGPGM
jgi:homoaconitase/3-isopropylmalate dehydratase large subunit